MIFIMVDFNVPILDILRSRVAIGSILTQIAHIFRKCTIKGVGNGGFEFQGGLGGGQIGYFWVIFRPPCVP